MRVAPSLNVVGRRRNCGWSSERGVVFLGLAIDVIAVFSGLVCLFVWSGFVSNLSGFSLGRS